MTKKIARIQICQNSFYVAQKLMQDQNQLGENSVANLN